MTYEEAIKNINALNAVCGQKDLYDAEFESALALAIEALEKQATQEWISVDDRLPQDNSDALAYLSIGEESRICPANYAKGVWFDCIFDMPVTESVTHWMPLPQPPKGE